MLQSLQNNKLRWKQTLPTLRNGYLQNYVVHHNKHEVESCDYLQKHSINLRPGVLKIQFMVYVIVFSSAYSMFNPNIQLLKDS